MERRLELDQSVLGSLSAHIAVLNPAGAIVAVNDAWINFARENGNPPESSIGIGADYVAVCRQSAAEGDDVAAEALAGILTVIDGNRSRFTLEYPCHSPDQMRWFTLSVTPLTDGKGVVVSHEDITARRIAEDELRDSHERLEQRVRERTAELERVNAVLREEIAQRTAVEARLRQAATVFESSNEAIIIADQAYRILAVNGAFVRMSGYDADEVVGRDLFLDRSDHHDDVFYDSILMSLRDSGQWQGEIWNRRNSGEAYPAWKNISRVSDESGTAVSYVAAFSDISDIKDAEARLYRLAYHDPLTDLANRQMFASQLGVAIERARRHQQRIALLFLDIDNFKLINDTLGHAAGDELIQSVASRLRRTVRGEDIVARWGGDEFVILVEELANAQDAALLAGKLMVALAEPARVSNDDVNTSVSVGISLYPDDAETVDDLIKMADAAMYHAKECGRNNYQFYRAELTNRAFEYLALQSDLRQALERQEFLLHFQPQISLQTGRIDAFEALIRWQHPTRGLVLPDAFIKVAEDTGLIHPIGEWVLRTTCDFLRSWHDQGLTLTRVAVNISARELLHGSLLERVQEITRESGLEGKQLMLDLEITENLQQAGDKTIQALEQLRDIGLGVSIDDFGTGYSSLHLLRHLPVDTLKIDKSFVRDVAESADSRAVVQAVLALGHSLRLNVVGEGVETAAQLAFLREQGCDLVQGYYFSDAVPAEAVPDLLSRQFELE